MQARSLGLGDMVDYARLVSDAWHADGVHETATADEMRLSRAGRSTYSYGRDSLGLEDEGRLVAAGDVRRGWRDGRTVYELWGAVDPAWRRRGLGSRLLTWQVHHAQVQTLADKKPWAADIWAASTQVGTIALATSMGFVLSRQWLKLRRMVSDVPAALMPAGLKLRPARMTDLPHIWAAHLEAFRDHAGWREPTSIDYERVMLARGTNYGLWRVAWDGDVVAGLVLNYVTDEGIGRIERVSVRRRYRRLGLGRALMTSSLRSLSDAGAKVAELDVDGSSTTGALDLYFGMGFTVHQTSAYYRKTL